MLMSAQLLIGLTLGRRFCLAVFAVRADGTVLERLAP